MTKIKQNLKTLSLITATVGLSLVTFSSAYAWGPERATFTMEEPATYPTFNSITNNPTIGNELDFVRVGEIDAEVTELKNEITVKPGKQYLVYVYFHNNASATYNDEEHNRSGVAVKTRMSSSFSTVITPEAKGTITATITAENTNPVSVWDDAFMTTTTEKVLLSYVEGSAKIYNDYATNGQVMPSSLFTEEGTLLGLNALNGVIPGCEQYHGVVTYVLQAEELGGSISKSVSIDGKTYSEKADIKAGDEVYFKLTIKNTGDVALTNATVKDQLPKGLTLVPGSVELTANDSTTPDKISDAIVDNGQNLGTIGTGNTVYIRYIAKASGDFDCDPSELVNNASLTYDTETSEGETKKDTATIKVTKADCAEPETPEEIVNTGPVEIALAVVILLGIAGGGFYFYRTKKALKDVENEVSGKKTEEIKPEENENNEKDASKTDTLSKS